MIDKGFRRFPAVRTGVLAVLSIIVLESFQIPAVSDPQSQVIAAGLVLAVLSVGVFFRKAVWIHLAAPMGIFILFWVRMPFLPDADPRDVSHFADLDAPVQIIGQVISEPRLDDETSRFVLAVDTIRLTQHIWIPVTGHTQVTASVPDIRLGERMTLTGFLSRPPAQRNPGEFDYRGFLDRQGIGSMLRVSESVQIRDRRNGDQSLPETLVSQLRTHLYETNRRLLSPDGAAIVNAMLLGIRHDVPDEVRQRFSETGTIHILALSGLHTAFIIGMILGVLGFLRVPRRTRFVLAVLGLWFYVWIADFLPSVTRAAIMATVMLIGWVIQRRGHVVNSLFAALLLILFWNPFEAFNLGLQLSFLAVLSIVLLYPRVESLATRWFPRWQKLGNPFRGAFQLLFVSISAQLGTLPLTLHYFGMLPITSIIANVAIVPMSGVILSVGALMQIALPISPVLASWYAAVNDLLVDGMLWVVRSASELPLSHVHVWTGSTWQVAGLYGFLACACAWSLPVVRRWTVMIGMAAMCVWAWIPERPHELIATFLDVGQGDCAVIQLADGRVLVVDAGDARDGWDYGERVVGPFLRRQGYSKIDFLVLSHPHDDHIGGAPALLREFEVGRLFHAGQYYESAAVDSIQAISRRQGRNAQVVRAGDFFGIDEQTGLYFLGPRTGFADSTRKTLFGTNNSSVVFMMKHGQTRWLFAGDAEVEALQSLQVYGSFLDSDVLKLSHHGSWNGSPPPWIAAVRPEIGVISCATRNSFGHPSPSTLVLLREVGCTIRRTDREGAVTLASDGRRIRKIEL